MNPEVPPKSPKIGGLGGREFDSCKKSILHIQRVRSEEQRSTELRQGFDVERSAETLSCRADSELVELHAEVSASEIAIQSHYCLQYVT